MLLTLLQDGKWAALKQSLQAPPSFFLAMLSLLRPPIFFFAPLYQGACSKLPKGYWLHSNMHLFVPQFTSPVTTFTWTHDCQRKNFSFCGSIWENILQKKRCNMLITFQIKPTPLWLFQYKNISTIILISIIISIMLQSIPN